METYFAQQHHITAPITGQTPGHSIENFSVWPARPQEHEPLAVPQLDAKALNHAQRGFPEERIRFHTCYGVNFGPRLSDLQLDQVMDPMLTIKAGAYSFEAANPRHDHEGRVARKFRVPEGKILIPGRPYPNVCESKP